jgi:hypothetical protein
MGLQRYFVLLSILFFSVGVARADKVTADYDKSVNFSRFKTFMWMHEPETNEPFMKQRIMNAVNAQLTARGMRQVSEGADLVVASNLATDEKHTWDTYYNGAWDWGGGWSTTTERTYLVGTLTVDLFDAHARKLIWQGVGIDTLSHKPEKRTKDYDKQIEKMFREFPLFGFHESKLRELPAENSRDSRVGA